MPSRPPQNVNNNMGNGAIIKNSMLRCANNLHALKNLSSSLQGLKRNQNSWEVGGYTLLGLKEAYQRNAAGLTNKELAYFAYLLSWHLIEKMGNQPAESIIEDERLLTALISENRLKANQPKWVKTKLTSILANIHTLTEQTKPWRDNPQGNQEMMPDANWLTKKRLNLCAMRLQKEYGAKKPGVFRKTHAEIMASLSEAKLEKKRARVKWYDKRFIVVRWLLRLFNFEKDRAYCVYEDTKKLIDTLKNNPNSLHENNAFNTKLQRIQTQARKLSTFSRLNPTMEEIASAMNELPLDAYIAENPVAQQANIPNPPEEIASAPEVELTLEALDYIIKCRAFINECHLMIRSYYKALIENKPSNLINGKDGSNIALEQKDFFQKNEEALNAWKDNVLNAQMNEQKKVLAKDFRNISMETHPDKAGFRKVEMPDSVRSALGDEINAVWTAFNTQMKQLELPELSDFEEAIEHIQQFATTYSSIDENSLFFKYIFKKDEFNFKYNENLANINQSRQALENEELAQAQRREEAVQRREEAVQRREEAVQRSEEAVQRRREAEAQRELIELQQKANINVTSSNLDIEKDESHEPRRSFQM